MLMDLDDSLTVSLSELDKGISTITQSHNFFDCYPAVLASYEYTKTFNIKMIEAQNENIENANDDDEESEKDEFLEYKDFGLFLYALRTYFTFCQV